MWNIPQSWPWNISEHIYFKFYHLTRWCSFLKMFMPWNLQIAVKSVSWWELEVLTDWIVLVSYLKKHSNFISNNSWFKIVLGLSSTCGLVSRKGLTATDDCEPVQRMRSSGAIPLALTNTSEICMWWETYNKLHGRTNNPYDTTRTVGGSSGKY